jgi:hypothetical protein
MKLPVPSYPDANFTIRLTYGNVKPYDPKDASATTEQPETAETADANVSFVE